MLKSLGAFVAEWFLKSLKVWQTENVIVDELCQYLHLTKTLPSILLPYYHGIQFNQLSVNQSIRNV